MMRLGHLPTEAELKRMVAEVDQVTYFFLAPTGALIVIVCYYWSAPTFSAFERFCQYIYIVLSIYAK